jgi:uncharacterized protein YciI
MKFVVIAEYIADADKVAAIRPEHRTYCRGLRDSGRLAASGPFTDGTGAMFVYEVDSAEAAEAILRADPFFTSGVIARWQLRPWQVTNANRDLFPA